MNPAISETKKQSKMTREKDKRERDDADIFREQSMKAIRRRKYTEKAVKWILCIVAASVVAFAFFAYFIDE